MENVPTSETGSATSGMMDARQVCEKDEHDDDDENKRFDEGVADGLNGFADENRGVVGDVVIHAFGK